jgi:uncharacterized protein (DUF111 family)
LSRVLYFDPAGGVAGDMVIAALSDLAPEGVDPAVLAAKFREAGVGVEASSVEKRVGGLRGRGLALEYPGEQPLRHLENLLAILEKLDVSAVVRERSGRALTRLAEVEAFVHGAPIESVHFHEVGAVDTIFDVVGAFWGVELLEAERVISGPLPWFTGEVVCAHGTLPLPAPATLKLMLGKEVTPTSVCEEIITPTGALIVDQLVEGFESPTGRLVASGVGYGDRVVADAVNGLRAMLFEV